MVKVTEYKLRKTAKNKGIIGYQNKPKKELLRVIYKLKHSTDNLSGNGINKIVNMQNLSLNELTKIERINNLSLNALKQTAIARNIKNYEDMSKEDLLIALTRSNERHTELLNFGDSNTEIGETKKLFNKLRSNFSLKEIKEHREEFHKKELRYKQLKEKDSLTKEEKKELKNIMNYFEDLKENFSKIKTYQ